MPKRLLYAGTVLNGIKIIEDLPTINGKARVKAICPFCGKEFEGYPKTIKSGECKSCGCLKTKTAKENLIKANENKKSTRIYYKGQIINNFYIIDDIEAPEESEKIAWVKAICPYCKKEFNVRIKDIKSNNTKSCGCIKSHGEQKINLLLSKASMKYSKEFSFDDLKANYKLRFDFAIFNEDNKLLYLIEYDGIQHFQEIRAGWSNLELLEAIQYRDKLKNDYCKQHRIPLIRIPYTQLKNLSLQDLQLETSKFII